MHDALVDGLIADIGSAEATRRDRGAEEVTDVHRGFSDAQVHEVASALVAA